jgi:hypothetical protein
MFRTVSIVAMALLVSASVAPAFAQAPAKEKISRMKLKEMKAGWSKNKPKYKACRTEVKTKGLAGDDRWFYISDCMGKS